MSKVDEIRGKIIDIMVQPVGYFKEVSAENLLDTLINAVREEERANIKLVVETPSCPDGCNMLACSVCAYQTVCDLMTQLALKDEFISHVTNKQEIVDKMTEVASYLDQNEEET